MAIGDVVAATAAGTEDLHYVDVGLFDTPAYGSVYILDTERPALVDTGTGYRSETVLAALAEVGIAPADLAAICLTHVHLDHAGGASVLARACPTADIYVHESGARFLRDPGPLWEGTAAVVGERIDYYRKPDPIPEERIVELAAGDTVDLGDHELDVHRAPGHAFHQVVFHDRANDGIFVGDAAGIYVPQLDTVRQTSPPPGFHLEECLADIEMLQSLDPTALYYGHFGDLPAENRLAEYAQRLTAWVESVQTRRAELDSDEDVRDFFSRCAETRDIWEVDHARGEERMNVDGVFRYLDERGGD